MAVFIKQYSENSLAVRKLTLFTTDLC